MKKILLAAFCLSVSLASFGQDKEVQKEINEVKFYGVDFSKAQAYGVSETIDQFTDVFGKVNSLFISEPKKYNVDKHFKVNATTAVRQLDDLNKSISSSSFFGEADDYQISTAELAEEIKALPIEDTKGVGLVFVAELLNKPANQGTYHIVFFDIASREILDTWKATGRAKGFGLRNYWAGSIFSVLEGVKIKK